LGPDKGAVLQAARFSIVHEYGPGLELTVRCDICRNEFKTVLMADDVASMFAAFPEGESQAPTVCPDCHATLNAALFYEAAADDRAGPYALLLGLFLLTAILGQLISNMATALIVIPVALSAAAEMEVSPEPVLMAVAVSAAAAFLTPVATPANLMVMGPGGYRFGDYWKLGLSLLALFGVVAVFLVPVFWSL
jgi:hypothetical protein